TDDENKEDEGITDNGLDDTTDVTEDNEEEDDKVYQEDFTDASSTSGEDQGTYIVDEIFEDNDTTLPEAAVVGGAGALLAGGAAVSGGGSKNKKNKKKNKKEKNKEEKKTSSSYKMYVNKDFGDVLSKNDQQKYVYARIVEVEDSGYEKERDDLTQRIRVFSGDNVLSVSDAGMTTNGYKAALVSVPEDCEKMRGQVSFTLSGVGGTYVRHVEFKIVLGDPEIVFTKIASDGVSWAVSSFQGEATLIAGLGGTDKVPFYIANLYEEPKELRTDADSSFKVTFEKEKTYENGYYAVVENCSEKMEKAHDIVAKQKNIRVNIEAELNNGTVVSNYFIIALYPDGITVVPNTKFFKDDILQVCTVPEKNPKPGEIELMPSAFDVLVCYRNENTDENIILENPSMSFKDPDDEGKYGNTFKENFSYRIDHMGVGGFDFYPLVSLPVSVKPYETKMTIIYKGKDGAYYEGVMPIEFLGEKPLSPELKERQEVIKRLKRAIEIFGLDSSVDVRSLVRNTDLHSTEEIKFITKYLLIVGIKYYQDESKVYTSYADLCDKYVVVSSAMVKAGDMALEYLLKVKFGDAGEVAAKFINPFKNMYFEYIGQFYGPGSDPDAYSTEQINFKKTLTDACSDYLEDILTGEEKPSADVLGFVVAGYLMLKFVDHFTSEGDKARGDVYRSILAAIGDLTILQFKEWVSGLVETWTGPVLQRLQEWFGDMFKKFYSNAAREAAKAAGNKAFENGIKSQIKNGIGYAEYQLAKNAKSVATEMQQNAMTKFLDMSSEKFAEDTMATLDIGVGFVLNYFLRGTTEEGDVENLKASELVMDTIKEFFCDKLGLEVEGLYETSEDIIGLSSVRIKGFSIVIGFKGYEVEINIAKNIKVIFEFLYNYSFSWMEEIYKYCTSDNVKIPDKRELMEYNTKILDETLEIVENPQPIIYRDK
ncbi:MAG: hypothetical protein J6N21_14915, partial [Butyrivibrio sp.]|nr:hypothetical protein [Butyrivibrio sp.]